MIQAAIPIGVDLVSPLTWFVVAVGAVVLALTLSTRRSNTRPRPLTAAPAPSRGGEPAPSGMDWAAAQTLFLENPRAGCERARALVERLARERGWSSTALDGLEPYRTANALTTGTDPSTEQLRAAFVGLRAAHAAVAAGGPPANAG